MQEIGPAMNEIRAKYGKDRQKVTEEQMKLYKERGYNPASGCLPLIVQMPILFAMYAAFLQAPDLTGDSLRGILWPFVPNPVEAGEQARSRGALAALDHQRPGPAGSLGSSCRSLPAPRSSSHP